MPNTEPDSNIQSTENSGSLVHVAVGVVVNREKQILIAHRHQDQHQGGLWEFPGGKVDSGEHVQAALKRELLEEVNITVRECAGLMSVTHDYGDKKVLLDVWYVNVFSGDAAGLEGQKVLWVSVDDLEQYDFPAANQPIISAVKSLLHPGY